MPVEIVALVDKPHLLVTVLFVGAIIGMAVEYFVSTRLKRSWRKNKRRHQNGDVGSGPWLVYGAPKVSRPRDAADQLRIVMGADFVVQPLLSKSEARVFRELDRFVVATNPTWQVMAQVSLGEILRSPNADAYGCINSKRVDLLLVDGDCQPRHAIEYQGGGHYQGNSAARDAIKKEALRRAGIGYHEVIAGRTTPADLKRLVETLVDQTGSGESEASGRPALGKAPQVPPDESGA